MAYASQTKVPIDRTVAEIRTLLEKNDCDGFAYAQQNAQAYIAFQVRHRMGEPRMVKMGLKFGTPPSAGANEASRKTWEQIKRAKWRAMLLCVKAKIESMNAGIETLEEAFMPYLVLADGLTLGEKVMANIAKIEHAPSTALLGYMGGA